MRFKKGDYVIVRLEDKSTHTGRFVEEKNGMFLIDVHCAILAFAKTRVREYEPIDDEVTDAWCKMEAPNIVKMIQKGMECVFPGYQYKLSIENDTEVSMDGISLMPATLRVETIVTIREVPGFQLVEWKHYPATRTEPEDVSDKTISDHRTASSAALALMKHAIANHVDRWFESESEARFAEEQERLNELGDDYYG